MSKFLQIVDDAVAVVTDTSRSDSYQRMQMMIVTANLISLRLGKNTVRSAVCQSYFMAFSTSYLGCFLSVSVMISSVLLLSASFAKSRVMIT